MMGSSRCQSMTEAAQILLNRSQANRGRLGSMQCTPLETSRSTVTINGSPSVILFSVIAFPTQEQTITPVLVSFASTSVVTCLTRYASPSSLVSVTEKPGLVFLPFPS